MVRISFLMLEVDRHAICVTENWMWLFLLLLRIGWDSHASTQSTVDNEAIRFSGPIPCGIGLLRGLGEARLNPSLTLSVVSQEQHQ